MPGVRLLCLLLRVLFHRFSVNLLVKTVSLSFSAEAASIEHYPGVSYREYIVVRNFEK